MPIVPAALGDRAGAIGAALLAARRGSRAAWVRLAYRTLASPFGGVPRLSENGGNRVTKAPAGDRRHVDPGHHAPPRAATRTATTTRPPPPTERRDGTDAPAGEERPRHVRLASPASPGVTDDEISYAAIGTLTNNPLGTCILECYVDGIKAYFAYRNSEGGIFGRDLVLGQELDDALGNNQAKSLEVASGDDAFGAFQATLLAPGWGDLDDAGVPTYTWGIHATEAANREHIFPSLPIRCGDCTGRAVPFAVQEAGVTQVAALGYGDSENSKVCTRTIADSIELYSDDIGGAEAVYVNEDLPFGGLGERIGPIVTAMKDADVDFIATCMDSNGMKTLGDELARQGMDDVVIVAPEQLRRRLHRRVRRPVRGRHRGRAVPAVRGGHRGDGHGRLHRVAGQGGPRAQRALDGRLAQRHARLRGAPRRRTRVRPRQGDRRHERHDRRSTPVASSSRSTGRRRTSRTRRRRATSTRAASAPCRCASRTASSTTVVPPETPWLCWPADLAWSEPEPTSFG